MARDSSQRGLAQWVGWFLSRPGATFEEAVEKFDVRFPGVEPNMRRQALSQGLDIWEQSIGANRAGPLATVEEVFGHPPEGELVKVRVRFGRGSDPENITSWMTEVYRDVPPGSTIEDILAVLGERAREDIGTEEYGVEGLAELPGGGLVYEFLPTVPF